MFVLRDTVITWPMDNQPSAARWAARLTGDHALARARAPGAAGGPGSWMDCAREMPCKIGPSATILSSWGDQLHGGFGTRAMKGIQDSTGCCLGKTATNFAEVIAQAEKIRELCGPHPTN